MLGASIHLMYVPYFEEKLIIFTIMWDKFSSWPSLPVKKKIKNLKFLGFVHKIHLKPIYIYLYIKTSILSFNVEIDLIKQQCRFLCCSF